MPQPIHSPNRFTLTRTASRVTIALLAAACCTACATASSATREQRALIAREPSHPDSVVVRVVNHSTHRLAIARVRQGTPSALGAVSAGGEARFALSAHDVSGGRLTLVATPIGDHVGVRSAPFAVRRGQVAVLLITPTLVGSQVLVDWPDRSATRTADNTIAARRLTAARPSVPQR